MKSPVRVHNSPYRTLPRCPDQVPWHTDPKSNSLTCLARVSVTNRLCLGNVQCLRLSQHVRSSARQWWVPGRPLDQRPLGSFELGTYTCRGPSRLPQLLPPLPLSIRRRRVHPPSNTSIPSLWPVPVRSLDHTLDRLKYSDIPGGAKMRWNALFTSVCAT